jgi:hypothetical protein
MIHVCHSIKIKFGSFSLPDMQEIVTSTPFEALPKTEARSVKTRYEKAWQYADIPLTNSVL